MQNCALSQQTYLLLLSVSEYHGERQADQRRDDPQSSQNVIDDYQCQVVGDRGANGSAVRGNPICSRSTQRTS